MVLTCFNVGFKNIKSYSDLYCHWSFMMMRGLILSFFKDVICLFSSSIKNFVLGFCSLFYIATNVCKCEPL